MLRSFVGAYISAIFMRLLIVLIWKDCGPASYLSQLFPSVPFKCHNPVV